MLLEERHLLIGVSRRRKNCRSIPLDLRPGPFFLYTRTSKSDVDAKILGTYLPWRPKKVSWRGPAPCLILAILQRLYLFLVLAEKYSVRPRRTKHHLTAQARKSRWTCELFVSTISSCLPISDGNLLKGFSWTRWPKMGYSENVGGKNLFACFLYYESHLNHRASLLLKVDISYLVRFLTAMIPDVHWVSLFLA